MMIKGMIIIMAAARTSVVRSNSPHQCTSL